MNRTIHIFITAVVVLVLPVIVVARNGAADGRAGTLATEGTRLLKWEVLATHGKAGRIGAEVTNGYVESRQAGIARLRLTFSGPVDPTTLGAGAIDIRGQIGGDLSDMVVGLWLEKDDTVLVVQLADALDDADRYKLALSGRARAFDGGGIGGLRTRKLAALVGDTDGSGKVNYDDLIALRSRADAKLSGKTARFDVNCDGRFGPADEQLINKHFGRSLPKIRKRSRKS
ncbi:MAG: hypothetical protein GWP05_07255 [Anaerolineaceae bacterium]|nr:hypothetical protein [Anaerolineaceae bacterium]